jgi:uncharacterized membrane protein
MRTTMLRGGAVALLTATVLALFRREWVEAAALFVLGLYFLALGYRVSTVFGLRLSWVPDEEGR